MEAIARQTNVKSIRLAKEFGENKTIVRADYDKLQPKYGQKATRIIAALAMTSQETILKYLERDGMFSLSLDNEKIVLYPEDFSVTKQVPHGYEYEAYETGEVYVNIITSPQLEAEGYARELMRRIQSLRKEAGLVKSQSIKAHIKVPQDLVHAISSNHQQIKDKIGAEALEISKETPKEQYPHTKKEKIRNKEFEIFFI